jgi:hypothetical protein
MVLRSFSRVVVALLLTGGLLACGSSGPSAKDEDGPNQPPNRLIVSKLSAPVGGMTAYDLVRQYKSHWLWTPGTQSLKNDPQIQVYINNPGSQAGSVSALKRVNADQISEIKYFPPNEAQFRFGMGNSVGAILISMKGGR